MSTLFSPLQVLSVALAGWINRHQQAIIDYLVAENRADSINILHKRRRVLDRGDEAQRMHISCWRTAGRGRRTRSSLVLNLAALTRAGQPSVRAPCSLAPKDGLTPVDDYAATSAFASLPGQHRSHDLARLAANRAARACVFAV